MKVRAKELGIWDGSRRRAGTVFEIPNGTKLASWMELVPSAEQKKPPLKEPTKPTTLSELAKAQEAAAKKNPKSAGFGAVDDLMS